MANYAITYRCGHSDTAQIVGPEKERPGKIAWLSTQACPDCRKALDALDVEAWTERRGLVALSGSEKQIAWANKIRRGLVIEVEARLEEIGAEAESGRYTSDADQQELTYLERGYQLLLRQSEARFWIDHRSDGYRALWKEMTLRCKASDAKAAASKGGASNV